MLGTNNGLMWRQQWCGKFFQRLHTTKTCQNLQNWQLFHCCRQNTLNSRWNNNKFRVGTPKELPTQRDAIYCTQHIFHKLCVRTTSTWTHRCMALSIHYPYYGFRPTTMGKNRRALRTVFSPKTRDLLGGTVKNTGRLLRIPPLVFRELSWAFVSTRDLLSFLEQFWVPAIYSAGRSKTPVDSSGSPR